METPQRIAVIGNCNAPVLANCLRVLRPADDVAALFVNDLAPHGDTDLKSFDIVFAVRNVEEFGVEDQLAHCRRVVYWPNIVFFGFHPDITYFGINGRPVRSAMGEYNSRIVAMGYALELSAHETERMFNRLVYAKLGFFDQYAISRAGLLLACERCGLDLARQMVDWERRGIFMYSINHPKLVVFADLAKALLEGVGLAFDPHISVLDAVPDFLASGGIWPVYPELAKSLGVAGSLTFTPPAHGAYDISFYSLRGYIEKTFAIYESDGFSPHDMREVQGLKLMYNALAA